MRLFLAVPALACCATAAQADALTRDIVETQILPAFRALETATDHLATDARAQCETAPEAFKAAYHDAFDTWIHASIWRFGPTETDARAFSLAFWPDNRDRVAKSVNGLLRAENRAVFADGAFAAFSIAGKGFYAMEHLLFDTDSQSLASATYRCELADAMAADIAVTAAAIAADWTGSYAVQMEAPSARYQSLTESHQELFKALTTGLEVIDNLRLGRPLGTFEAPRPRRAEARRSGRSLHHVVLSLNALQPLAHRLAADAPDLQARLDHAFDRSLTRAARLNDPVFAGVDTPQTRIRIEALRQSVADLRTLVTAELGPRLGVAAGFNALDGD